MIDATTIEEIKNRMDIVEVVEDFVSLKRSGSSMKALSPFTNEKTPSFYVVPSKGIFKDFSSGKGGDAITFLMEVDGLSYDVLAQALNQAKEGRLHILGKMGESISEPRGSLKSHAPRMEMMRIDRELIGAVIGPGGKIIQEIQKESGATVNIEEDDQGGKVSIFAVDGDSLNNALARIKAIVQQPEVGEVYEGKVKSIMPFGAFVEFLPGKDGLLHISEIKWERVENVSDVMEEGEEIKVKLIDVDKRTGKFKLSRKVLIPRPPKPEQKAEEAGE